MEFMETYLRTFAFYLKDLFIVFERADLHRKGRRRGRKITLVEQRATWDASACSGRSMQLSHCAGPKNTCFWNCFHWLFLWHCRQSCCLWHRHPQRALLVIQLPSNVPGTVVEDGPNAGAFAHVLQPGKMLLTRNLGLVLPWLMWLLGVWISWWTSL